LTTRTSNRQSGVIVWHKQHGDAIHIIGVRETPPHERGTDASGAEAHGKSIRPER
jgi:hypothetical protein